MLNHASPNGCQPSSSTMRTVHMAGQFVAISIGAQIYYAESVEKLVDNMAEAPPTIMTAVPRLYESIHARIQRGIAGQKGPSIMVFIVSIVTLTPRLIW